MRVGHAEYTGPGQLTGTTVVLAPPGGAVCAVDVRGGGPGTRETDALDPRNLVQRIEAVVLTGGSAFGLDTAAGVAGWLEEQGRGFPVGGGHVVPVVPAAALFDLGRGGDWTARPDRALGRAAVAAAARRPEGARVRQGCVGAGAGAVAGGLKGGVGTASQVLGSGTVVAALAAVNSSGRPADPATGALWGAQPRWAAEFGLDGSPLPPAALERARAWTAEPPAPLNTTLAVVATDADLTRAQAHKLAGAAHDGLARAIRPAHLLTDGDTVFTLATGRRSLLPEGAGREDLVDPAFGVHRAAGALDEILAAGADTLTRAVLHAVLTATTVRGPGGTFPSYRDLYGLPGPGT
ncbi:P1 family peptidase [Actinacidiphila yeochonensis]|uniref:P1 family peptidase n=1 Tax=Actinacidiphila yeochonensis TaxID=89050 RepID=UPI0007C81379